MSWSEPVEIKEIWSWTSKDGRFRGSVLFQILIKNILRNQIQPYLNFRIVSSAPLHALKLHKKPHRDAGCCQLFDRLWLRVDGRFGSCER